MCKIMGRPARGCRTFARSDFIRVPRPAASTTMLRLLFPKRLPHDVQRC
jgi:hypothetical protein